MNIFITYLTEVCDLELQNVEKVFTEERAEKIEANKAEIENLFNKRREMELQILYAKQAREEDFQNELSKIRGTDAEDYNSLKVTLEKNIQLLEQQLEEMRATYQLNSEVCILANLL
jgi:dynein regulatory complex protein 1